MTWRRWWKASPVQVAATTSELAALQQQLAVAQAVETERRRIYDDLHDDVGSRLLSLLHRVPATEQPLVREILQDLRAILSRERSVEGSLLEVLAQLRDETEQRLQSRDLPLDWQQRDGLPDPPLNRAQTMHLFRIGREAVTNALKHADAGRLRVVIGQSGNDLIFEVTDDGQFDPARIGDGRGTRSMRNRADELQGAIQWQQGTLGGTKVRLSFPLPPAAAGCPAVTDRATIPP
ncbi:MAG: hypothetical protein KGL91_06985 [Xanthomonadaceae bacterium]|nr:hypothetical protein [Xanthomonadaceae bacterium]